MDYQKLYDLKKAENLLKKHGLMDTNLKKKIDDEAKKENAKKEKEKK